MKKYWTKVGAGLKTARFKESMNDVMMACIV